MRIAWVVLVALAACKVKKKEEPDKPIEVQTNLDLSGSAHAMALETPPTPSKFKGIPNCEQYARTMNTIAACEKFPQTAKDALKQAFDQTVQAWETAALPPEALKTMDDACKSAVDALAQAMTAVGCEYRASAIAEEDTSGSRDVPSEKGVPLDRAVLGSLPHPFGALEPLKVTMTRDQILAAIPDARRDGQNILVPLGVEALTAKILIDTSDHISDVEIPMSTVPEVFEQAWGASDEKTWMDPVKHWRADFGGNDEKLHIFPYKNFVDVIGSGPDLLVERTPIIGQSIEKLRQQFGGRIDEWSDEDEEGNTVTRPRLLLPSTDVCHFDSMYLLILDDNDIVVGAKLDQCFDTPDARKKAMAAMEKRWGRASPSRTTDDKLAFRFSRPGRTVEMHEDPTVDPAGSWIVTIRR